MKRRTLRRHRPRPETGSLSASPAGGAPASRSRRARARAGRPGRGRRGSASGPSWTTGSDASSGDVPGDPSGPGADPLTDPRHHHHVYVVLLDAAAGRLRKVRAANPDRRPELPCVYVGMTGLTPEERFENHRNGLKAAWVVRRFGLKLMPELFAHLNPMPFDAAAQMERDLAEDLRRAGYTVTGGH